MRFCLQSDTSYWSITLVYELTLGSNLQGHKKSILLLRFSLQSNTNYYVRDFRLCNFLTLRIALADILKGDRREEILTVQTALHSNVLDRGFLDDVLFHFTGHRIFNLSIVYEKIIERKHHLITTTIKYNRWLCLVVCSH